jgi:hypothetical protein
MNLNNKPTLVGSSHAKKKKSNKTDTVKKYRLLPDMSAKN